MRPEKGKIMQSEYDMVLILGHLAMDDPAQYPYALLHSCVFLELLSAVSLLNIRRWLRRRCEGS